jgi:hypothetical protein
LNPFTHVKLSREIHQYINQNYDLNIPLKTFIWGNVKPDFKKEKKLHYIDISLKETIKMYNELNGKRFKNVKKYTVKLGEFFHYVSDFFCYAHSIKFFKENLGEHFLYEMKAHKKLLRFKNFFDDNTNKDNTVINGSGNLTGFLLFQHKKYMKNWKSPESDYIYTLKIAPVLINNIVVNNNIIAEVS